MTNIRTRRLCSARGLDTVAGLALAFCVLGILITPTASAQVHSIYASIVGTVTDSSGAVAPGAKVTVTNQQTGISSASVADSQGFFQVMNLIQGTYRLTAEQNGFKQFVREEIHLAESQTVRSNVTLQVGATTQTVQVTAQASLIQTESPQISHTLPFTVRKFLPTVTPNFFTTLGLTAGAVTNTDAGYYVSFSGSGPSQYDYSIDGQTFRDPSAGHNAFLGNFDEWMADQTVSSVNSPAEYSQLATINASTKNGTNQWHGSGVEYYTEGKLKGRNPFSPTAPTGNLNIFAGSLGGPIKKNKAFFFVAYSGNRNHTPKILNNTVPTAQMRSGDFSQISTQIIDPATGQPFPGNIIPSNQISSVATAFITQFYPLPNYGGSGFRNLNHRITGVQAPADDDVVGRMDYRFSDRHSAFVRYGYDEGNRGNLIQSNFLTAGYRNGHRRDQDATLSDIYSISPTLVNEFRTGFSRDNNLLLPSLTWGPDQSGLVVPPPPVPAIPQMNIAGFSTVTPIDFYQAVGETFTAQDNVSWVSGRHQAKFGVLFLRGDSDGSSGPSGSRFEGVFGFTNTFGTGYALANFLLGIPTTEYRASPYNYVPKTHATRNTIQVFAQDDIQITPKLTVNAGLRYEWYSPWSQKEGRLYSFDPATGNLIVPDAHSISALNPNLLQAYGSQIQPALLSGYPLTMINLSPLNFAPRIGFAYRPFENTVIRSGFGIYYDFNPPAGINGDLYAYTQYFPNNEIVSGVPTYQFPDPFSTVNLPPGFGLLTVNYSGAKNMRVPYSEQWSLTAEHQFRRNTDLRLSYIGNRYVHGQYINAINEPAFSTTTLDQADRPYPSYGPIGFIQNGAGAFYNALQINVSHRGRQLSLNSNFTWAKDLAVGSLGNGLDTSFPSPLDPFDRQLDYGPVSWQPAHRFVTTADWNMPLGRGRRFGGNMPAWANKIAGGWIMTGIFTASSGDWLTPSYCGYDPVGNPGGDFYCGRPDRVANGNLSSVQRTQSNWFNSAAFVFPGASAASPLTPPDAPIGRLGNSGVGVIEGPGWWQFDYGLIKGFSIGERWHIHLFALATNVLNHPNLADPAMDISTPSTVGQIFGIRGDNNTSGIGMRVLQLGARVEF